MSGLIKSLEKQVLFYNLQSAEQIDKSICQITSYYYKQKMKILIVCEDKTQVDKLNDLLWTFEQISFIPHSFESDYDNSPVIMCMIDSVDSILTKYEFDILFNLSSKKMPLDTTAKIYLEIVTSIDDQRDKAREKFSYYKNNNVKTSYENF